MARLRESEEITEYHKHKNMGAKRLFRDEQDVQEIINIILDNMSNLFLPNQLNTLTNIATSLPFNFSTRNWTSIHVEFC